MDTEQYKSLLLWFTEWFAEWLNEQGYLSKVNFDFDWDDKVNFDFDWDENSIERTESGTSVEAVQEYLLSGEIMGPDFISKK